MAELAGRHALVTGASRGIGRGIALHLAVNGADVTAHGRDLEALRRGAAGDRAAPAEAAARWPAT